VLIERGDECDGERFEDVIWVGRNFLASPLEKDVRCNGVGGGWAQNISVIVMTLGR